MEANFYQVEEISSAAIAPLLFKIIEQGKKALIYCPDNETITNLDASLWSFGRNKFLPHVTIFDKDFDFSRQPIVLTNEQDNINQADYLLLLREADKNFIKKFERIFYFYNANDNSKIDQIKNDLEQDSFAIKSFKKDGAKWVTL